MSAHVRERCYACDRPRSRDTAFCRCCQKSRAKLLGMTRAELLGARRRALLVLARIDSVLDPMPPLGAVSPT